eukprot:TRINITY_DN26906_c0_g1_i1.p1 TRINITY_DN26906_c0_g1~~TRINITY_DN26906_c0_g1_i1.p1  ORF type:complete len:542 (-),score=124.29 TRINITY_DN26906_c0_g1_i1:119-1744(-)
MMDSGVARWLPGQELRPTQLGQSQGVSTYMQEQFRLKAERTQQERWKEQMRDPKMRVHFAHLLARTPLFGDTLLSFRQHILDSLELVVYATQTEIFKRGDLGDWSGIVLSGRCQMHHTRLGEEVVMDEVPPGGIVGDLGLLEIGTERAFSIVTTEQTTLLVLQRQDYITAANATQDKKSLANIAAGKSIRRLFTTVHTDLSKVSMTLDCFKRLDRKFVQLLCQDAEPALFYKGQVLMREHTWGDEMWIIRFGTVKVERGNTILSELTRGAVVGERAALASDRRRKATVTATSLVLTVLLRGDVIQKAITKYPSAQRRFDENQCLEFVKGTLEELKEERAEATRFFGSCHPRPRAQLVDMYDRSFQQFQQAKAVLPPPKKPALPPPHRRHGARLPSQVRQEQKLQEQKKKSLAGDSGHLLKLALQSEGIAGETAQKMIDFNIQRPSLAARLVATAAEENDTEPGPEVDPELDKTVDAKDLTNCLRNLMPGGEGMKSGKDDVGVEDLPERPFSLSTAAPTPDGCWPSPSPDTRSQTPWSPTFR